MLLGLRVRAAGLWPSAAPRACLEARFAAKRLHRRKIRAPRRTPIGYAVCKTHQQVLARCSTNSVGDMDMLWTILLVLLILWVLGYAAFPVGGAIHLLLLLIVAILLIQVISGRRRI
jgi:hypothetical protein